MKRITYKYFWINKVNSQIFHLGIGIHREYYYDKIVPKHTIKRLKKFFLDFQELSLKKEFQMENTREPNGVNWEEVRKINNKFYKEANKLARQLRKEIK